MIWRTVNTSDGRTVVVDIDGRPRTSWEELLEQARVELGFCVQAYETAQRQDYGIQNALMLRIDVLRASIYWSEYRLAKD